MSVREMVRDVQRELIAGDLPPARARELLVKLTALIGSCNDEIRRRDVAYALVLEGHLTTESKANRARMRAELSDEFNAKREARDVKELVVAMSQSLKYLIKSLSDEMQLSGHQR